MSKRTFRRPDTEEYDSTHSDQLMTEEPVAVYYRQSTTAQVGNISTTIQTVDMVAELRQRGWKKEDIILIDDDEGVSGTKRIDEREGMSYLFELIAEHKIGAVACQDEDRLFRDMTQIQVNIFIDTCRKSKVKVITPYITYDFAHPLHGEFHARQFRFKCDMAAEYIKSYVLGRLAPARQRLLLEGKWAGSRMPVGFMVDMRKHLPDGKENPNWRKYVPFEPYAQIVRAYFRIFLENRGAIRITMKQIRKEGLGFPDCQPPEGFKVHYGLKKRGDGYFINRGNFVSLLTNPAYIGHWCYKGAVQRWNDHIALVDNDTYMRAFNYLSQYTLTGEENQNYQPAYQHARPNLDMDRPGARPLLLGLIHTHINGKWYRTGSMYEKRQSCYLYVQNRVELEGVLMEWSRRATWVDDAVIWCFKQKLQATFDSEAWIQALQDTLDMTERSKKIRQIQLSSLDVEMENLVSSLKTLGHPYLIQQVEQRYRQMEHERTRLESELADIDQEQFQNLSLEQHMQLFERAAAEWNELTEEEKSNILSLFIDRIEASDYNRAGNMRLLIQWKDGSSDEVQLWHKPHSDHWTRENVVQLLALFDSQVSQLEIAKVFPDLKWYQIYNEIRKHRGLVRFTPSYLGKSETYSDWLAKGGGKGRASCSPWRPEELEQLQGMVKGGATQEEIMQQFPFRRWIQLQHRIKTVFGKGTYVPLSGISQRLTFIEYRQQTQRREPGEAAQETNTVNPECSSEN